MSGLKKNLLEKGVHILENHALTGLKEIEGGVAAQTSAGEIKGKSLVLATGALTPKLAKIVGWRAPIEPGKGYSITMKRPGVCPDVPLIFPETRVAVTPFADGYRLGSTMEFSGYDDSINPKRLNLLRSGVEEYLKEPYGEPVTNTWYGWRPMTYDSLPIIGSCPGKPEGNPRNRTQHARIEPRSCHRKTSCRSATGQDSHIGIEPYSPDRF